MTQSAKQPQNQGCTKYSKVLQSFFIVVGGTKIQLFKATFLKWPIHSNLWNTQHTGKTFLCKKTEKGYAVNVCENYVKIKYRFWKDTISGDFSNENISLANFEAFTRIKRN